MLIEKYTKLKNGQYKLRFDNNTSTLLHEDLILKYGLLIHKEIDEEQLEKLLIENNSYIAYDIAIAYLKIKMRSKKEIREYLIKKEVNEELIDQVIDMLSKQGYLHDDSYCQSFIHDRIHLSNDGPYKIKETLKKLGIDDKLIEKNIELFNQDLEIERIHKILDKQIRMNTNKSAYALKRKIIDYLVSLGYTKEIVIKEVDSITINDRDAFRKEYDKIYNKLSKKYTGKELEYKLRQKMYQKGFYNEYD